jgi:mono/diheme cytochrome c family protein
MEVGMKKSTSATLVVAVCMAIVWTASFVAARAQTQARHGNGHDDRTFDSTIAANALDLFGRGRQTFRFDTFGDEHFWGDTLQLHQAIEGARFGGVGAGISPAAALGVGLKVDVAALPESLLENIRRGRVDLNDPANTLALLRLNAIVGVVPFGTNAKGGLQSVGLTCALCHSTVDDSVAPGIGRRLDGWANRDLNVGAIIASAPDLSVVAALLQVDQATVRAVANSWGPGKFDAELFLDGKPFRPDGKSAATLIPPAFGLAGMNQHTYTGWGSVPYWNAFVANLEMHGSGTFFDPRLDDAAQFPVAARAGFGNVRADDDRTTAKLAPLQFYQLSIPAPAAPNGSFDRRAADRGKALFDGTARCSTCHVAPLFSEPGWAMHTGEEIGIDNFQADRAPDHRYRTTPLKGAWSHAKGGYYHDGRFATLLAVVQHYNTTFGLHLSDAEINDLVEYLKSL